MKTSLLKNIFLTLPLFISSASAVYDPNWNRPIDSANLTVESAQNIGSPDSANLNISDLTLVGTRKDGETLDNGQSYSGFLLSYNVQWNANQEFTPENNQVTVNSIENDCGSVVYHASLEPTVNSKQASPFFEGVRMSVTLIDNTHRVCKDLRKGTWEVEIRSGYGWCGTGDLEIKAYGEPSPVYTIQ
jgi:hypothetical protein